MRAMSWPGLQGRGSRCDCTVTSTHGVGSSMLSYITRVMSSHKALLKSASALGLVTSGLHMVSLEAFCGSQIVRKEWASIMHLVALVAGAQRSRYGKIVGSSV